MSLTLTPGDGLLLRGFVDHPADTLKLTYPAPKQRGRYHLALWLGTWTDGEDAVDERLNALGWVFDPEAAKKQRAERAKAQPNPGGVS